MTVLTVFGAATSVWALLAPLPLIVGATFMAGLSLGITSHVRDIDAYNLVMALFFSTMYMSGAFFPLEVLPVWIQIPARVLPLTESIELTRAFLTGRFLTRHIYEGVYLVISAVIACEWAMRGLRKRMVA
jgi:ABC-type multidrug transport system permease subunit